MASKFVVAYSMTAMFATYLQKDAARPRSRRIT
jgi:hypothetical protein